MKELIEFLEKEGLNQQANNLKEGTTTLDLTACILKGNTFELLINLLKTDTQITKLDLTYTEIGSNGAKFLSELLKANKNLKKLDLSSCKIGDKGLKFIIEALKYNPALTTLNLSDNNLSSIGVKAFAKILNLLPLVKLNLNDNNIGSIGIIELAEALKTNSIIKEITLRHTNDAIGISIEEAKAFIDALETNTTLIKLDIWYGNLGGNIMLTIDKYLHRNIIDQKEKILITHSDNTYENEKYDKAIEPHLEQNKDNSTLIGMQEYFL